MNQQHPDNTRKMTRTSKQILSWLFAALTLLFGYITLTVPVIASTGPAIITIALAAATYVTWRSATR